jgi:hypothetical protein
MVKIVKDNKLIMGGYIESRAISTIGRLYHEKIEVIMKERKTLKSLTHQQHLDLKEFLSQRTNRILKNVNRYRDKPYLCKWVKSAVDRLIKLPISE